MPSLEEIRNERIKKLEALEHKGIDPYPATVERTHTIAEAVKSFRRISFLKRTLVLSGRVMAIRTQGKLTFFTFSDGTGTFQGMLRKGDGISAEDYALWIDTADIGDFVEIKGRLFLTKKKEKTIRGISWKMLAKSLRPLPEKWSGLQDTETRYRERELDLISNPEVRERFVIRSKMVAAIRRFLDEKGFLEVETPIFQPIPGGANARPFMTHHNALDAEFYLRIAPELYLKRLIAGGFEKVYEIGRSFRNEGIDYSHNPEFTMLELYWAYAKKDEFVKFLEELMMRAIRTVAKKDKIVVEGKEVDFSMPWPRTTFRQSIIDVCGIDIDEYREPEAFKKAVQQKGIEVDFSGCVGIGEYYDQLYKKTARPSFTRPTWVFDYPAELKPLAKQSPEDKTKSSSLQLVVEGAEIINAYYHELNDPIEQRARFMEQEKLREAGSEEAQHIDEQFLKSLEYGMPPASGLGVGIDRLAMLLSGQPTIKEVILFPTLKPKNNLDTLSKDSS